MRIFVTCLLVAAPLSATSAATPVGNYAIAAIEASRYDAATVLLERAVRETPTDETAWLNLALVYRHSGRSDLARTALQRVLTLDNVMLDTADGKGILSHDLATRGLLTPVTTASR